MKEKESDIQGVSPRLEAHVVSELWDLLKGIPVGAEFKVAPSADFCYSLELFLPQLLSRRYKEWEHESLDGIFVANARKTGPEAAQFAGTCILISDQTVTPLFVDVVLNPTCESISSFRVCLGELGGGPLGISGPDCNSQDAKHLLATVGARLNDIRWSYTIASDAD